MKDSDESAVERSVPAVTIAEGILDTPEKREHFHRTLAEMGKAAREKHREAQINSQLAAPFRRIG